MSAVWHAVLIAAAGSLLVAGCATSPEAQSRREAIQADIEAILAEPLDADEYGTTRRCLAEHDYRNFRILDDRHILFVGRRGKQWINTLRMRCHDLRFGHVLAIEPFSPSRICDADRFQVADWFYWPWYRRWPWHWGGTWGTGMSCSFGKFQPVAEGQVAEIEAVLRRR